MNFCSNCGHRLEPDFKFCPDCGTPIVGREAGKPASTTPPADAHTDTEVHEFTSSMLVGGSVLTPDRIIINDREVTYRRRNSSMFRVDEVSIPFGRIASVEIDRKLINADITIHSTGNMKIEARHFKLSDAREIKRIINERLQP